MGQQAARPKTSRFLRVVRWFDARNQARADKAESKRGRTFAPTEVRAVDGSRYNVRIQPTGYPDPDKDAAELLPASLYVLVWALHTLRHNLAGRTWDIVITTLDDRGFETKDVRRRTVPSRSQAREAAGDITRLVRSQGIAAIDSQRDLP